MRLCCWALCAGALVEEN